jgi:hypothetical protein
MALSILLIGDNFLSRSAWVSGSPYSILDTLAFHGSVFSNHVMKLTTPNKFTAAANIFGYSVIPDITI